mmetsp:Transcript_14167/g.33721  ORF Transcript_14167/g.33721 Transcript_14167/m.33721 type:complete len:200 (-) Transcript_14167:75-674(-)
MPQRRRGNHPWPRAETRKTRRRTRERRRGVSRPPRARRSRRGNRASRQPNNLGLVPRRASLSGRPSFCLHSPKRARQKPRMRQASRRLSARIPRSLACRPLVTTIRRSRASSLRCRDKHHFPSASNTHIHISNSRDHSFPNMRPCSSRPRCIHLPARLGCKALRGAISIPGSRRTTHTWTAEGRWSVRPGPTLCMGCHR